MWFLGAPALADDLIWTCLTPSAPVDVHAWAARLGWHGAGAAGRAAFATVEARVDAACLADVYCYAPEVEANGVDDDCIWRGRHRSRPGRLDRGRGLQ
jgi:hypothetical protein